MSCEPPNMSTPTTTTTTTTPSPTNTEMCVVNRNGMREVIQFDRIMRRIRDLGDAANLRINYHDLVINVIEQMYDGIPTSQIDELVAQQCASMVTTHPDYGMLAGHIAVSNLHKNTDESFADVMCELWDFTDVRGKHSPLISTDLHTIATTSPTKERIQEAMMFHRDFDIDYFGMKTLERAYLLRTNGTIRERPQHMWMRVSLGIHGRDLDRALETYDLMSRKQFTHATPTLFNAGTPHPQLSSCYLLGMEGDSIDGIYSTLGDCSKISKWAGGIGLHIHDVRGTGSHIRGTNGTSNGIVPMLRVFNMTARYVDQCVTPETYIYTTQGPMCIANVCAGETRVLNSEGKAEVIENVLEHPYDGEMFQIKTMHSMEPLQITGEHPVYVVANQPKGLNHDVIRNRLEKKICVPEWKDVKDLTDQDMMLFRVPTHEHDITALTEEDCYVYGVILGDGYMKNNIETGHITLHATKKVRVMHRVTQYMAGKCVEYHVSETGNTARIRWNKTICLPFRYADIYDTNGEKHVHPRWLNLPLAKISQIVKGMMDTDGCVGNEIVFDSTSRNLIESMRYMLLRIRVMTSGYIRDRIGETHDTAKGPITAKRLAYCLRIPKTERICELLETECTGVWTKSFEHGDLLGTRVQSVEKTMYKGTLYDLQMKETHDYTLHNGLVHNGGGKRNGSFAIYLEPWHPDIMAFLSLKKNHGDEEQRARDLFYAVWMCDLFMRRVKANEQWSLFCPDRTPGLADIHGAEFESLYESYESQGLAVKTLPARDVWYAILDSQMETGTPYLLYKDAANKKSNQQNLGTIRSSNLCTEIMEYSDDKETAVCNLASIALSTFVVWKPINGDHTNLTMYSRANCRYCVMLRRFLMENNIPHTVVSVDDDTMRHKMFTMIERDHGVVANTVPQITGVRCDGDVCAPSHWNGYEAFVAAYNPTFNHESLHRVAKVIAFNLNRVIDVNFYPTEKTRRSNLSHRPIGIGVQGLADTFAMMRMPFESAEAKQLNKDIFETIYHAAMTQSMELARDRAYDITHTIVPEYNEKTWMWTGDDVPHNRDWSVNNMCGSNGELMDVMEKIHPTRAEIARAVACTVAEDTPPTTVGAYSSFSGSPLSRGEFQFDLWGVKPSARYDWHELQADVIKWGTRNSLLMAPMPTASTSQILGNNECFEPFTSNIYTRRTNAGEFVVINRHLMRELVELGLWSVAMKDQIIRDHGSVQRITAIPADIRERYKIVWEMSMRNVIDMAADRGAYICQSQSMNLWVEEPNYKNLTAMHFYSWSKGLKTGQYYLRRKPKHQPQQFTIEPEKRGGGGGGGAVEPDECLMCSG